MKYTIEEINEKKVIKTVEVISDGNNPKAIDVIYLDRKKNRIEYTSENYNRIIEIMTEQAKKYVSEKDNKIKGLKYNKMIFILICMIILAIGFSTLLFAPLNMAVGCLTVTVIWTLLTIPQIISCDLKIKDLEKYAMYLDNFGAEVEEYKNILRKEKNLGKKMSKREKVNASLSDIAMLDKFSLQELKEIREKVISYDNLLGVSNQIVEIKKDNIEQENEKQKVKSRNK